MEKFRWIESEGLCNFKQILKLLSQFTVKNDFTNEKLSLSEFIMQICIFHHQQ